MTREVVIAALATFSIFIHRARFNFRNLIY